MTCWYHTTPSKLCDKCMDDERRKAAAHVASAQPAVEALCGCAAALADHRSDAYEWGDPHSDRVDGWTYANGTLAYQGPVDMSAAQTFTVTHVDHERGIITMSSSPLRDELARTPWYDPTCGRGCRHQWEIADSYGDGGYLGSCEICVVCKASRPAAATRAIEPYEGLRAWLPEPGGDAGTFKGVDRDALAGMVGPPRGNSFANLLQQVYPDSLDVDSVRRSGRTTKQIREAIELAKQGKHVVFFVHNSAMVTYAQRILTQETGVDASVLGQVVFPVYERWPMSLSATALPLPSSKCTTGSIRIERWRDDAMRGRDGRTVPVMDHALEEMAEFR